MGTTESLFFEENEVASTLQPTTQIAKNNGQQRTRRQSDDRRAHLLLKAQIWGLPRSGKRTLLQRLQGKDPFQNGLDEPQKQTATAPYQVPTGQPTWDRIQLHVEVVDDDSDGELGHGNNNKSRKKSPIDFAVLLVDPRDDADRIRQHCKTCISSLLGSQGYTEKKKVSRRPFCLCLVLNFADKIEKRKKRKKRRLTQSDLQVMTMEILQDSCPSMEPKWLLLHCTRTSLRNCYGLSQLHYFIYQSYLLSKEWKLQDTLQQVLEAQQQSRQSIPEVVTYQDYTKSVKALEENDSSDDESEVVSNNVPRRIVPVAPITLASTRSNAEGLASPPSRKRIDEKTALEAFLGSDSEEENDGNQVTDVMYSSSSEGEEVFYDESGVRRTKGQQQRNGDDTPTREPTPRHRAYHKNNSLGETEELSTGEKSNDESGDSTSQNSRTSDAPSPERESGGTPVPLAPTDSNDGPEYEEGTSPDTETVEPETGRGDEGGVSQSSDGLNEGESDKIGENQDRLDPNNQLDAADTSSKIDSRPTGGIETESSNSRRDDGTQDQHVEETSGKEDPILEDENESVEETTVQQNVQEESTASTRIGEGDANIEVSVQTAPRPSEGLSNESTSSSKNEEKNSLESGASRAGSASERPGSVLSAAALAAIAAAQEEAKRMLNVEETKAKRSKKKKKEKKKKSKSRDSNSVEA